MILTKLTIYHIDQLFKDNRQSTKIRMVLGASCKEKSDHLLNDDINPGPSLTIRRYILTIRRFIVFPLIPNSCNW